MSEAEISFSAVEADNIIDKKTGDGIPQVSVIMGVYNQFDKEKLKKAIDSITGQSFKDFEFIIYDDGSERRVTEYLSEIEKSDGRIRLLHDEQNHGLGFALNRCIDEARGRYIARMDDDDISDPDRISIQKKFLDDNPDIAWCGTNALLFDGDGVWGRRIMPEFPKKKDYLKFSPFIHPSVMYRSSIFKDRRGYLENEDVLKCEDYEIFMRLSRRKLKGANIQQFLFSYREDKESYNKRTLSERINETKLRYRNFKNLKMLFPKGWLYVIRPLAAILIPSGVIAKIKRRESDRLGC